MKNLNNEEVQNLLNQIAQNNDKALKTLYEAYQPALKGFFSRKVDNISSSAVEEIVNEIFFRVWKNPFNFNSSSQYFTFLVGVGKNVTKDWLRKEGRHLNNESISEEDEDIDLPAITEDFFEKLEKDDMHEILRECIKKLPSAQQEVMEMFYFNDEKQVTIASALSIPVGTVKSRMNNAIVKVTACVKKAFG